MNNEVKEILNYLTKFVNDKEEITKYGCEISVKQAKQLLDYITNLQQENEKIRKMNMHEHKYGSDMEEKYLIEKAKNDRAVEYIKENGVYKKVSINNRKYYSEYLINQVLDILNGRSDE